MIDDEVAVGFDRTGEEEEGSFGGSLPPLTYTAQRTMYLHLLLILQLHIPSFAGFPYIFIHRQLGQLNPIRFMPASNSTAN